jgi:hypothetical protein
MLIQALTRPWKPGSKPERKSGKTGNEDSKTMTKGFISSKYAINVSYPEHHPKKINPMSRSRETTDDRGLGSIF